MQHFKENDELKPKKCRSILILIFKLIVCAYFGIIKINMN